jgi:opacity protein-like surface antigen
MKKSIALLFIIIALAWVNPVDAQEPDKSGFIRTYAKPGGLLSFEWIISMPSGDMKKEFISKTSTRGFAIEYRYMFDSPISVGAGFSWQAFYEKKERATYEFEGGAMTTTRFNYLYSFPIFVNAHYYPIKNEIFLPFVGINLGMFNLDKKDQVGQFTVDDNSWQFGFQPEIGTVIQLSPGSGLGFIVKGKYTYILYNEGIYNNISHFDIHVGATFVF